MFKKTSDINTIIRKSPSIARYLRTITLLIPDKLYLSWQFKRHMQEKINWNNPKTFNEKMQWLKIYWRDPLATKCADKFEVREFIEETIGKKYLTEIYGVFDNVEDININDFPDKFVLKATHGSAMNIVCEDKAKFNWEIEKKKLKSWLKTNYYNGNKEWVYKDIKPRIICEEYLGNNPIDYKLYCFNGNPQYWFVATDRSNGVKADYYELNWEKAPFRWIYPPNDKKPEIPNKSNEMIELAVKLSNPFPFVRVDFYEINNKILFGELTFFHGSGFGSYEPKEYNELLGRMLHLPDTNK
ncbi:MAG: ATP-grasp fold amidoligase family protein [Planococcus donghaensis]